MPSETPASLCSPRAPTFVCPCQVPKQFLRTSDSHFRFLRLDAPYVSLPGVLSEPLFSAARLPARSPAVVERLLESESKDCNVLGEEASAWSFCGEFLPGISWDICVFPHPKSEKSCSGNHENREKHNSTSMTVHIPGSTEPTDGRGGDAHTHSCLWNREERTFQKRSTVGFVFLIGDARLQTWVRPLCC